MQPREYVGEQLAAYLLDHVRERAPKTWRQGARKPAFASESKAPSVQVFAGWRVRGVCDSAVQGLLLASAGFPLELRSTPATAAHVLALQARGSRCISLLPPQVEIPAPHAGALEFALHDLCHLAKFADQRHYLEQVGFFASVRAAIESSAWQKLEAELDSEWQRDRDQVIADMNGSSIFLFAALKMKLKMAARRKLAAERGVAPPKSGRLSEAEEGSFTELLSALLDAMKLEGPLRAAAITTSARRDCPRAAATLAWHFRAQGAREGEFFSTASAWWIAHSSRAPRSPLLSAST